MPFGLHPAFLVILLVAVLVIFGPGKLPQLGGAVGRSLHEFRRATREITDPAKNAADEHATPSARPFNTEAKVTATSPEASSPPS
jgi:sec-independent protein translocase protein TatA